MQALNRRNFLRAATAASAGTLMPGVHLLAAPKHEVEAELIQAESKPVAANDHIQIALIGAGGQGMFDTRRAVEVPGVKLVAVADCYNGMLTRPGMFEMYKRAKIALAPADWESNYTPMVKLRSLSGRSECVLPLRLV